MSTLNKQGVLMGRWFKTPNAMIDDITGDVISPQAAVMLNTILRLTEGVRGREWAYIPHSLFMRKTQTKRRETIAKYIKELTDNELICLERSTGKVTGYAVNWKCGLWYGVPIIDEKNGSNVPVCFISTCTLQPYMVVRFNRTGSLKTCTFHPYTYKDIKIKDNTKDIKIAPSEKKDAKPKAGKKKKVAAKTDVSTSSSVTKPDDLDPQIWGDLLALRKRKKAPLSPTAWKMAENAITAIQKQTGHNIDQIVSVWVERGWSTVKLDWYMNNLASEQQQQRKINQQGATYENSQSNHQQPLSPFNTEWDTSTTAGYGAKLDADAEAYYASLEAEQGDDRGYQGAF